MKVQTLKEILALSAYSVLFCNAFSQSGLASSYREETGTDASSQSDEYYFHTSPKCAETFLRLGHPYRFSAPAVTRAWWQKAFDLLPDNDPGKPYLAVALGGISADENKVSPKDKVKQARYLVEPLRLAAQLDEKNDRGPAKRYLLLAQAEADIGDAHNAVSDALRGLSFYHKHIDLGFFTGGYLGARYFSELIPSGDLASSLSNSGHAREGKRLIVESIRRTENTFGAQSFAAANQIAELFVFYVKHNREQDALRALDRLLRFNARTIEIGYPSPMVRINQMIDLLTSDNKCNFAVAIGRKILRAQEIAFDADDIRIASTFEALTRAFRVAGRIDEAKRFEELEATAHQRCQELQKRFYVEYHKSFYDRDVREELEKVASDAIRKKDFASLDKVAGWVIKLDEHTVAPYPGRWKTCTTDPLDRTRGYTLAVTACIGLNKPDDAIKMINRAKKSVPELTFHEAVNLARSALKCGDKQLAKEFAEIAVPSYRSAADHELISIFEQAGDSSRAEDLRKLSQMERIFTARPESIVYKYLRRDEMER